ncbi:hypothetical protein [Hymenobacter jejuensis]|uniref:Uncharacterized protein n=1 Tax=Hymenobacter jejuensis TaxID=2502781 RepID=A0A5B8A5H4_9BACT|nr:hypothetical protein [Hymenobacter jejuensis]QDA61913.1 hypothetical protein FHG12_18225 [Hymenobacter jejuensis]
MQPEDIDKLFRDRLQGHAPTPPAYLWDQLEAELKPAAKKRPVLWLYAAAAAIALLLVASYGLLLRGPATNSSTGTLATTKRAAQAPTSTPDNLSTSSANTQATPTPQAASSPSEAGSEALAATTPASVVPSELAPAVHTARSVGQQPAARRSVALARATRPTSAKKLNTNAPAQAVAVNTPAPARPERPAVEPTATPEAAQPTAPALVAAAAPTGPIVVEVRRGDAKTPGASAYAANDAGRRPRLGNLLLKAGKKVGNAVLDGRQINLPKVELPEVVTAQVESWTNTSHP